MRGIVLVSAVAACSSAAPYLESSARSPVGCYALELGPWSGDWSVDWNPPEVIRLDSVPAAVPESWGTGFRKLSPQIPAFQASRGGGLAWWTAVEGDSLRLHWVGGSMYLKMGLARHGDELEGRVQGGTDVILPADRLARAAVRGRRVRCPAALTGATAVSRD